MSRTLVFSRLISPRNFQELSRRYHHHVIHMLNQEFSVWHLNSVGITHIDTIFYRVHHWMDEFLYILRLTSRCNETTFEAFALIWFMQYLVAMTTSRKRPLGWALTAVFIHRFYGDIQTIWYIWCVFNPPGQHVADYIYRISPNKRARRQSRKRTPPLPEFNETHWVNSWIPYQ